MVCAATIPGRWAAPPAPAMITFRPWPSAPCAYSAIHAGVRWADTTCLGRHAELVEHLGSVRMVSQSDFDPMMTATSGAGTVGGSGKRTAYQMRGPGTGDQGPGEYVWWSRDPAQF